MRPKPHRDSKLHDQQHKRHEVYIWFGPSLWCNTLLQCGGGGLPLGLMMNSRREEQPPEVEVFLCLVGVRMEWILSQISCLLLWWLVLFIEALDLSPNVRQEGIPQRLNYLMGDN